ncbi:glycoside hydrolase family 53 protein [Streptomyces johnsoniae]|uniref:Arabinogalactan endo-beta-1,4-galactanase n=1 Tax=Streptomyces johnsoniae TaxID=3075532 RepID=A0ABU2SDS4_9ACTN|nr:glycosyl hydrolase 53 family protein [Streptomyces sp. DSM 41886]MDT0447132.1 glycosyl hydrolase 53 family protein [Streptomyces sp. DSM 41886]
MSYARQRSRLRARLTAFVLAAACLAGLAGPAGAATPHDQGHDRPGRPVADDGFAAGGDLTMLNWVEDSGGRYYDENGRRVDPVQLMAANGMDLARLRVYTATGPDHPRIGYPDSYLPEGYQDKADMLDLARRVTDNGMETQLTLHYSDYWSNGAIQDIPSEWRDVTDLPDDQAVAALEEHVRDYTREIMLDMRDQGTVPAYVSLGNEMQGGILFPYGTTTSEQGWENLARFLRAGYEAVKEVSPSTQVILHLDDAGNMDKYEWFFSTADAHGIPYDVIGASYYPFWTRKDIPTVCAFFEQLHERFGRKIMVMETGINWNQVTHDGVEGQLTDNGPVPYPETPQGQADFLTDLFRQLKEVDDGAVIGDIYWDPVMIPAPGVGWEVGQPNVVSNTTLFDFRGRALPALSAYRTA